GSEIAHGGRAVSGAQRNNEFMPRQYGSAGGDQVAVTNNVSAYQNANQLAAKRGGLLGVAIERCLTADDCGERRSIGPVALVLSPSDAHIAVRAVRTQETPHAITACNVRGNRTLALF